MNIDHNAAVQAHESLMRGSSVIEVAQAWDVSPAAIYSALKRYDLELPKKPSPADHVKAQQESGVPPDLYAARAGIALPTLRNYASSLGQRLGLSLLTETREWWAERIEDLDPAHLQSFCITHDLPVHLLGEWYHRIKNPEATLLWGFTDLREVTCDMFHDVARFANQHAPTHLLGRGITTVRTDIRIATEAYRHSVPYCA